MSKYTTGKMEKLCKVTVQFYDTKGLLIPSDLTEGGRRLYTDDDLTKLRLICTFSETRRSFVPNVVPFLSHYSKALSLPAARLKHDG